MPTPRALVAALALATLAACANRADLDAPVDPIGDFRLGHNIVVARETTKGPLSREASAEEIETALRAEIEQRLRRFDGDGLYHLGVRVEAYVLAQPGIPIVLSPKSILLLAVNIWDNETRERLNDEPIRVTAFEGANTGVPFLPSGLTKSREEQLENLSIAAAQAIEKLLRENEAEWFAPKPGRERLEYVPAAPDTNAEPGADTPPGVEPPSTN
jgi:hypothetical protein